ncbi:Uncharacterized protein APZ42_014650 [Daphnia magna]|uniref:Uncharacterized protein n=1 Tax=Daphnia magna TaxID=35525 RepID=A0A162PS88_9CRUS|nr:Uncharacterized protein APZ42_014650 [Daphnia magna]
MSGLGEVGGKAEKERRKKGEEKAEKASDRKDACTDKRRREVSQIGDGRSS